MPYRRAATVLALLLCSACSPLYVLRAGWEELQILSRRQPIAELVQDPDVPREERAKLALVLEARDFAAHRLRLDAGDSYTTFSRLDSDTLALIVSAARKDRFEAHTWWFPIVGHVPYKGFFSESKARRQMAELERRGYDAYLRPTAAFSTLGWFNDPLVSTLLRYDSVSLVNTVVHELLHNTLYVPGQAMFNESLATFVGARGAIDFFCSPDPEGGPCARARAAWRDELRFGGFVSGLVAELEALYARDDLSQQETLRLREEVFRRARTRFQRELRPELEVSSFASFTRNPLNNATLLARRLYYGRLELFERVHQLSGGDLSDTIGLLVRAGEEADGDPYAAVERLAARLEARPGLVVGR